MEQEERQPHRKRSDEDQTPLWIKLFGGSILSILFLCVITLTGYFVSNLNSLQSQINILNVETTTKKEFNERQKVMWDSLNASLKADNETLHSLKEKLNAMEQLAKDRQVAIDKYDTRLKEQEKDLQLLRERLAALEGKTTEKKKD